MEILLDLFATFPFLALLGLIAASVIALAKKRFLLSLLLVGCGAAATLLGPLFPSIAYCLENHVASFTWEGEIDCLPSLWYVIPTALLELAISILSAKRYKMGYAGDPWDKSKNGPYWVLTVTIVSIAFQALFLVIGWAPLQVFFAS